MSITALHFKLHFCVPGNEMLEEKYLVMSHIMCSVFVLYLPLVLVLSHITSNGTTLNWEPTLVLWNWGWSDTVHLNLPKPWGWKKSEIKFYLSLIGCRKCENGREDGKENCASDHFSLTFNGRSSSSATPSLQKMKKYIFDLHRYMRKYIYKYEDIYLIFTDIWGNIFDLPTNMRTYTSSSQIYEEILLIFTTLWGNTSDTFEEIYLIKIWTQTVTFTTSIIVKTSSSSNTLLNDE